MNEKIQIGVSSCLMGMEVRHNGGHKRNNFICDTLGEYFQFTPFCPEVASGLGTPRPAIRLIETKKGVRLVNSNDQSIDHSTKMIAVSDEHCSKLGALSGYIVMGKSPSCGMERVNIYNTGGHAEKKGVGLFTQRLMQMHPNLPVEEEGRLNDAQLRENFIERVLAYQRWQTLIKQKLTVHALIEFHKRHKFMLLAHDEPGYRKLGKLVANATMANMTQQADQYISLFMQTLKKRATKKRHVNVLQHAMGYLKEVLLYDDKQELLKLLNDYKEGIIPLVVPVTLFQYHFRKHPIDYISEQYYMSPYPDKLMLRNSI